MPDAGQRRSQLGVPAQELIETRFEYPVHRHGLTIAVSARKVRRKASSATSLCVAAVEIAQRRDTARHFVVAEQDRGARADPVGPPHPALQIPGIAEFDAQARIAQPLGETQQPPASAASPIGTSAIGRGGAGGSSISIASRSMPAAQPTPGIAGPPIISTSPS